MGRNTIRMMPTPNATGRATSSGALVSVSSRSSFVSGRPNSCWRIASRRMAFSTITTEPSTISPKSTAPRLNRLAEMPACNIKSPANSIESGMAAATTKPARRLPRNANRMAMTSSAPASRLCLTVSMTLSTSSVRS